MRALNVAAGGSWGLATGTYYPAADGDLSRLETDATDPDAVQALWDAVADTLDDHDTRPLRAEEDR